MGDMTGPLNFEIEADELEIFIQDVNEHLQAMEAGVLHLEQGAVRSVARRDSTTGQMTDLDTLNAVFRAAHTLKAIAATVGHRPMAELTHNMETFFDTLRDGRVSLTQAMTDELLVAVDALKALRDEVISLEPSGVNVAALLARLHTLAEEAASGEKSASHPTSETAAQDQPQPEAQPRLTPEQAAQAQDYVQKEYILLETHVTVRADAFAPAARLLQAVMALTEVGQIVAQHPSQADLANEQHQGRLWLILATQTDQKAIEELLGDVADLDAVRVLPYAINPQPDSLSAETARHASAPSPGLMRHGEDKTVRISVERLDSLMNLVGELVTDRTRLLQIAATLGARYGKGETISGLNEMTSHFSRVVDQLQGEVLQIRMLPLAHLFSKFPRLVRDVAREADKQVNLVIEGESTELDRSIIEAIGDPLAHLLRNGVGHGIEPPQERVAAGKSPTGSLWLTAAHEEGHIVITVQDDGRGIDPARTRRAAVSRGMLSEQEAAQLDDDQAITLIFQPGVSTAERVTGVSGRGVGLDVVHTNVKRLGGSVTVESEIGRGTTFRITLPLTLAILQTMLVALGNDVYAIPLTGIVESLYLSDVSVGSIKSKPVVHRRGRALPLLSLREFFAHSRLIATPPNGARKAVVTVTWGKLQVGLIVDALIGKQEIVVKSLSPIIGNVAGLSGCAILGNGRIALIVDVPGLINAAMRDRQGLAM
jgi:two-component system chemotaxis sensor kinase CheA